MQFGSLVLVSPPVSMFDFRGLAPPPVPTLITVGDRDGFCDPVALDDWLGASKVAAGMPRVVTIPGCDHFYWGFESVLVDHLTRFLDEHF